LRREYETKPRKIYIKKVGGVEGEIPRLKYMLVKSFTANSFRLFWNAWNPIFSYVLLYYVYKPSRRILPKYIAVILTFVVNGFFHDFIALLILNSSRFVFTKLFLLYGLIVVIESILNISFKNKTLCIAYNCLLLFGPVVLWIWIR